MREIKFRAWTGTRMFDVDVLAIGKVMWDSSGTGVSLPYQPSMKVMQYTGLKDKNGVEIYEGDILEYYDLRKGVFIFKEQPKRREAISWSQNDAQYRIPDMGFRIDTDKVEIIGNIYENPELLNQT